MKGFFKSFLSTSLVATLFCATLLFAQSAFAVNDPFLVKCGRYCDSGCKDNIDPCPNAEDNCSTADPDCVDCECSAKVTACACRGVVAVPD